MKTRSNIFRGIACLSLLFTMLLSLVPHASLRAAGGVTVNLAFREASAREGEYVTLDVSFSSFPSITRFGPIEVGYDAAALEFSDMQIGRDIPDFELTYEMGESGNAVKFSAINSVLEEAILQNSTGDNDDPAARSSARETAFSSDSEVVVATLRFKVLPGARGEIKAWLGSISGLRDSVLESVVAGAGTGGSFIVQAMVSSDATLSSLGMGSLKLEPEFDPGIFHYRTTVSKNITDVSINAVPYNLNSSVSIEGESNLVIGSNTAKVTVQAEDGQAVQVYTIEIYRSDSLIIEDVHFADKDGINYDFVPLPNSLVIPANFYQSTCIVDGNEVPCFRKDGILSVLLFARTEGSEPALYIYNQETDTMRRYEPGKMVLRSSLILTVVEKPVGVLVPDGFSSAKITYGTSEIDGYISGDHDTRIAYLQSEDGSARFYVVDPSGDVYPYRASNSRSSLFLYLFIVCASIAVAEALIIGILVYRKKNAFRRKAKPRRV